MEDLIDIGGHPFMRSTTSTDSKVFDADRVDRSCIPRPGLFYFSMILILCSMSCTGLPKYHPLLNWTAKSKR
jgi:hypothetical protein